MTTPCVGGVCVCVRKMNNIHADSRAWAKHAQSALNSNACLSQGFCRGVRVQDHTVPSDTLLRDSAYTELPQSAPCMGSGRTHAFSPSARTRTHTLSHHCADSRQGRRRRRATTAAAMPGITCGRLTSPRTSPHVCARVLTLWSGLHMLEACSQWANEGFLTVAGKSKGAFLRAGVYRNHCAGSKQALREALLLMALFPRTWCAIESL